MRAADSREPSVQIHTPTDPGLGPEDGALLDGIGRTPEPKNRLSPNDLLDGGPKTDPDARRIALEGRGDGGRQRLSTGLLVAVVIVLAMGGTAALTLRFAARTAAPAATVVVTVTAPAPPAPAPTVTAAAEPATTEEPVNTAPPKVAPKPGKPADTKPVEAKAPEAPPLKGAASGDAPPPLRVNLDALKGH